MGHFLALILGGIVLAAVAVAFFMWAPKRPQGRVGTPVGPEKPSADAPTPDRSVTSPASRVEAARRHTPPA